LAAAGRRASLPEFRRPVEGASRLRLARRLDAAGRRRPRIGDYHHALDLLGALRLCANVPGQFAIEAALTGPTRSPRSPRRAGGCTKAAAP
jgi:hypothetical protein